MIFLATTLAAGWPAEASTSKTLIQDVMYRADGTPAQGTLLISWGEFTTAGGDAVAAGSMTVTLGQNGSVSVALFPNSGSNPQGYYQVMLALDDGTRSTEYWVVPQTAQTTIGAVRSNLVPQSQAMQFVSRAYVDSAISALATPNLASPGPIGATTPGAGTFTDLITLSTPVVDARGYPGSDCGAKIQAADTALGGAYGTILVTASCGAWTSAITLGLGHDLQFAPGAYTVPAGNLVKGSNDIYGQDGQDSVTLTLAAGATTGMFVTSDAVFAANGTFSSNGTFSASNVTFRDLTFDGNRTANSAACNINDYVCGHGLYILSGSTTAANNITIRNNTFQNFRGSGVFTWRSGTATNPHDITIRDNNFFNIGRESIKDYSAGPHLKVTGNVFNGWGLDVVAGNDAFDSYDDAIYATDVYGAATLVSDVDISNNEFINSGNATKFAIELFPSVPGNVFQGRVANNFFDANGGWGTGLSATMPNSTIVGNSWTNCLTTTGNYDRCGTELYGSNQTITGNTLVGGAITVQGAVGSPADNVQITGNTITTTGSGAAFGIACQSYSGPTHNITIVGNTIDMRQITSNSGAGISVGFFGVLSEVHDVKVTANSIIGPSASVGTAIHVWTAPSPQSTGITIENNNIDSVLNGVYDVQGDSSATDITVKDNHITNSNNPIQFLLTGAVLHQDGNITSSAIPTDTNFNVIGGGYEVNGTTVIDSTGKVVVPAPAGWGGYTFGAFGGQVFAPLTPVENITLQRVEYTVETASTGCSSPAFLGFDQFGVGGDLLTVPEVGVAGNDSGSISLSLAAGQRYFMRAAPGTGCSGQPVNASVGMQAASSPNNIQVWSGAFGGGPSVAVLNGTSVKISEFTPTQDATVVRLEYSAQVPAAGCSVYPLVQIYDNTASSAVAGTAVTNIGGVGSSVNFYDSGVISAALTAGHQYVIQVVGGTGCSQTLVVPVVNVQYQTATPLGQWMGYHSGSTANDATSTFGEFTPAANVSINRIGYSLETASAGCSVAPNLQLYDATASAAVSGTVVSQSGAFNDSGVISIPLVTSHRYQMQLVGGTGCSTTAAAPSVAAEYAPTGQSPGGLAGGDLGGNYPYPTVAKINGAAVPVSKTVVGTNSNGQLVDATSAVDAAGAAAAVQAASLQKSNNLSDVGNAATALGNLGGLSATTAASTYETQTAALTTFTVGTTAIGPNTCTSGSTVTMTGVATTSVFMISPNADVSGLTGWGSTGGLVIDAWPTTNTLNYKVCNQTASSITPGGSVTFNVGAR